MATQDPTRDPLTEEIAKLLPSDPRCSDWGAKMQELCERVWGQITVNDEPTTSDLVQDFLRLLSQPEALSLAQMVIPDLRTPRHTLSNSDDSDRALHPTQAHIVYTVACLRPTTTLVLNDDADDHYQEQRRILLDAELYRAQVYTGFQGRLEPEQRQALLYWIASKPECLLAHSGTFTEEEERAVEHWIATKPKPSTRTQTSRLLVATRPLSETGGNIQDTSGGI